MIHLKNVRFLTREANIWLQRHNGNREVLRVMPDDAPPGYQCYELYVAFDDSADYCGRILFDTDHNWIYDGDRYRVDEQEQLARFIMEYIERT